MEATDRDWLSPSEIAKKYGYSYRTIQRHIAEIPHIRLGDGPKARIRIRCRDFEAWGRSNAEAVSE